MAFDFNKLRGRIIEKYGNQQHFAKEFGISENTLSLKLNNKVRFTRDDIIKMTEMLDIPQEKIGTYFFTERV